MKKVLITIITLLFLALTTGYFKKANGRSTDSEAAHSREITHEFKAGTGTFLDTLRIFGVYDACKEMNIDFDSVFALLADRTDHPYRHYRWSVSRDERGKPVIHALPPEVEMGWTPWERWSLEDAEVIRSAWVLYPIQEPLNKGVPNWYKLEESRQLSPRLFAQVDNLEARLRLGRIDEVSEWLGLDFKKVFMEPLDSETQEIYGKYRWVVIPHLLAEDGPVIYALPPKNKSDDWPWESWYTDGKLPLIHHVHYTVKKMNTTGIWKEGLGAPQRPAEIFGHTWYWYDDPEMLPALSRR